MDISSVETLFQIQGPLTLKLLLPARDLKMGTFRSRGLLAWLRRWWLLLLAALIQFLCYEGHYHRNSRGQGARFELHIDHQISEAQVSSVWAV